MDTINQNINQWTKKDGTVIPIAEMDREHLISCINLIKRNRYELMDDLQIEDLNTKSDKELKELLVTLNTRLIDIRKKEESFIHENDWFHFGFIKAGQQIKKNKELE